MLTSQDAKQTRDREMQQSGQKERARGGFRQTVALAAICLGYFMVILDATAVTVALPDLQRQLGATITDLQWVVAGYTLVFASLLLSAGALGDRLGNKRIFLLGLVLFTSASALCALAPNMLILQLARLAQGLGAALQVPASLALLNHTFHDSRARARAIGVWGGIAGIAAAAGPVIGGLLVNALTWRSVFFLNVPVGILAFLLTLRFVSAVPGIAQRSLDLLAQFMGIVALGLLTLAFIQGPAWGWSSWPIVGALIGFVLATALFLHIERSASSPMLPLELFASRTFSASNAVGLLLNFAFYGQLFILPLFLQDIRGYSPLITGLAMLPEGGVVVFASTLSGRVTGHTGPRLPMVSGLLLGTAGFLAMMFANATISYWLLVPMLVAIGFGMAFTMPAMTTAVIASAPRERSGIASGVVNASRQAGGALGMALLGSLVSQRSMFVPGMHAALAIAGVAFLFACALTLLFVQRGR
jgi:DHA2 family methylenomycin A resistance protein-like MFS transporter